MYCSNNQLSGLPTLPNTLTHLCCSNNQLLSLPDLPNSLIQSAVSNNPFNLWHILIDSIKINMDFAEIICEKLSVFNDRIQELQDKLNKNGWYSYNKKIAQLKKDIQEVLNATYEIIL